MHILSFYREDNTFSILNLHADGSLSIECRASLDDLEQHEEYTFGEDFEAPVAVQDFNTFPSSFRRPEPGETISQLVWRMMEEPDFDYDVYNNRNPLIDCVHGSAV